MSAFVLALAGAVAILPLSSALARDDDGKSAGFAGRHAGFAEAVRQAEPQRSEKRERLGLSKSAFGREFGLHVPTVSQIEATSVQVVESTVTEAIF